MKCPACGACEDNFVKDSRHVPSIEGIRRRRECRHCHNRWTTYEITGDSIEEILIILKTAMNNFRKRAIKLGLRRVKKGA